MRNGGLNKKRKEGLLTTLVSLIKKDPTPPIKNHATELIVHEKTLRTVIKQDLNHDLNPLNYAICGILENQTNATSYANIDSLKISIGEEWNKMLEEFMVAILSEFTILRLSSNFIVYFLSNLILFYNRVFHF